MSANRDLIMHWYKALETVDLDLFQAVHHHNVVYDISGHSVISGRHQGLAGLMDTVLPLVFAGLNIEKFQFCTNVRIMCEEGDCLVGIMEADGEAANGKRYDQRYVHIFEIRDGKIARVIEFFDTALAADVLFQQTAKLPSAPFQL